MTMALRTKAFAKLLARSETRIEEVEDLPAHRAKRARLQRSPVGRWVFGTVDKGATTEEIQIAGRRALVHRPRAGVPPLPCVIDFHGGGWVQGNPEQSQWLASRLAARNRCVVVTPAYRLGPEHPFPAAVDDARAVVEWVVEHADEHAHAPVLTSANMRAFTRLYLGESFGTEDHRASPIRAASHADLPKTFILTAELDPLKDNGSRYRDALVEDGVAVRFHEYPDALHGFLSLPGPVPAARQALDDICEFLQQTL